MRLDFELYPHNSVLSISVTSAGGSIFIQQVVFVAKAKRQLQVVGYPLKRNHIRIHLTTFIGEIFLLNEDRAKANFTTIEAIF